VWATLPCLTDERGAPVWLPLADGPSGPVRLTAIPAGAAGAVAST
jgi:hypothetical protein